MFPVAFVAFGVRMEPLKLKGIAADDGEVTLQTEMGLDIVFAFESKDRMYFSLPITSDRVYYQRSGAASTSVAATSAGKEPVHAVSLPPAQPATLSKVNGSTPSRGVVDTAIASSPESAAQSSGLSVRSASVAQPGQQGLPSSETQYAQAVDAMQRGDTDASLRLLSTALSNGFVDWQRIDREPSFGSLVGDVRFQVLRSRWKKS